MNILPPSKSVRRTVGALRRPTRINHSECTKQFSVICYDGAAAARPRVIVVVARKTEGGGRPLIGQTARVRPENASRQRSIGLVGAIVDRSVGSTHIRVAAKTYRPTCIRAIDILVKCVAQANAQRRLQTLLVVAFSTTVD